MGESIYDLSYILSLKNDNLVLILNSSEDLSNQFDCIPLDSNLVNIYLTTIVCFLCQVTFALFLAFNFRTKVDYYIVNWQM